MEQKYEVAVIGIVCATIVGLAVIQPWKAPPSLPFPSSIPQQDHLLRYYTFEEGRGTVLHDWVSGKDGKLVNSPSWASGPYGGALDYDSSREQYVDIPPLPRLSGGYTLISFSCAESWGKSKDIWLCQNNQVSTGVDSRKNYYIMHEEVDQTHNWVKADMSLRNWNMWVGRWDGNDKVELLKNKAVLIGSHTGVSDIYPAGRGTALGACLYYDVYSDARQSLVMIYNTRLTNAEIQQIYNNLGKISSFRG